MGKLIIDGNSVYELDEACVRRREQREQQRNKQGPRRPKEEESKRQR